jgi:serine/threonine-protein kinase
VERQGGEVAAIPAKMVARNAVVDARLGTVLDDRYRIEAKLGEGGMGSVYRVEHLLMRKRLALKILHREMTANPEMVARFEREALASAHIDHPNVAAATDFGKLDDGTCYLVLEYVEGVSLRSVVERQPMDPPRAMRIAKQILSALKRAHELGIVHRDLKPENILLVNREDEPDFVKILDFGIARVPIGSMGGAEGPTLTQAGMVYGTPEYMAPEQALGQEVDGRSDLYAVGVLLFEMLAGKRPYDNKDKVALLGQHVAGPIPRIGDHAPSVYDWPGLDDLVSKLLAKSSIDRYQTADEATEALVAIETKSVPFSERRATRDEEAPTIPAPEYSFETGRSAVLNRVTSTIERMFPWFAKRVSRRWLPMATGLAIVGIVALVGTLVFFATRAKPQNIAISHTATTSRVQGAPVISSASATDSIAPEAVESAVHKALASLDSGDTQNAVLVLESLSQANPQNPLVLHALSIAYHKANRVIDALAAAKNWAETVGDSPDVKPDSEVLALFDEATVTKDVDKSAFEALVKMRSIGAQILFRLAFGDRKPAPSAAIVTQARRLLNDPEIQGHLTPQIRADLAVINAPMTCTDRLSALKKYEPDFDDAVLPILRQWDARTGCGFFRNTDCWPCLHDAQSPLDHIVNSLSERSKKAKP